jgi:hypothetical protein
MIATAIGKAHDICVRQLRRTPLILNVLGHLGQPVERQPSAGRIDKVACLCPAHHREMHLELTSPLFDRA